MYPSTESIRRYRRDHPSSINGFVRLNVDLCSRADTSLEQTYAELPDVGRSGAREARRVPDRGTCPMAPDSADLPLTQLIQHKVRVHNHKVPQGPPRLAEMASKVAATRSDRVPELDQVVVVLEELHSDLLAQIQTEAQVLFPFIAQMDQELIVTYPAGHASFRSVSFPIFMMEKEHDSAGHIMETLGEIRSGFEPPEGHASSTALFPPAFAISSPASTSMFILKTMPFSHASFRLNQN